MFLKPYRSLLLDDPIKSKEAWLIKDMAVAPVPIIQSLETHLNSINKHIMPVTKNMSTGVNYTDISFKFTDQDGYILRDLAFGVTIAESLIEPIIKKPIEVVIDTIFNHLYSLYFFLTGSYNPYFEDITEDSDYGAKYQKSFVIGLSTTATSIHEIEFLDILFDTHHDIIPSEKMSSLCPEFISRTALSLRLFFKPQHSKFKIEKEIINCSTIANDGTFYNTIADRSSPINIMFQTNSIEYYFETYFDDIESLLVEYLKENKELLYNKLGYEPAIIDKNILKIIDMMII